MERIERQIELLMQGKALTNGSDHCDFSIAEQNEVAVAKGVTPSASPDFQPILRKSVTYIVCVVLFNENNELLMIQEAKASCSGQWYLPAGRMEPGETIEEAAKREVLEETGLECDLTTLLLIESAQGSWFRFVLTGRVIGGKLKTTAEADAESLQAKWISNINELKLRSHDIVTVIERGKQYYESLGDTWHKNLLPVHHPHTKLLLRIVVVIRKRSNNNVHVLVSEHESPHLPVCEINPTCSIYSTLKRYMQKVFGSSLPAHKPNGVMCIENYNKPVEEHDGLCLTLLVSVRNALEDVGLCDGYTWLELSGGVGETLIERLGKNMTVMLNVIR